MEIFELLARLAEQGVKPIFMVGLDRNTSWHLGLIKRDGSFRLWSSANLEELLVQVIKVSKENDDGFRIQTYPEGK